MEKSKIVEKIEAFAPLETQEKWDCSGWLVETSQTEINKVMLCLTVTNDVVRQAKEQNCDMIISHHPLFSVPLSWKNLDIYCAHTNLDKAQGGTTDTLINYIFPLPLREREQLHERSKVANAGEGFVRYINYEITISEFLNRLRKISPNLRYVNNHDVKILKKIAFCAGSGSEFIQEAYENGADAFVTGDLKFHPALESPIAVFDIGHFESEILVLPVFEKIIGYKCIYAKEENPFKYLDN